MKKSNIKRSLQSLLEQCETDTRNLLSAGAASRLGNWRLHAHSDDGLVKYIQERLKGPRAENGWKLKQLGGLSLEEIVIERRPDLFTEDDRSRAKQNLGISN
jgi:hypothetical protein